jgi:hypothetical protein
LTPTVGASLKRAVSDSSDPVAVIFTAFNPLAAKSAAKPGVVSVSVSDGVPAGEIKAKTGADGITFLTAFGGGGTTLATLILPTVTGAGPMNAIAPALAARNC